MNNNNYIKICKFRESDLIRKDNFVIFVGDDLGASMCRIEPRRSRKFVPRCHIADYDNYLYMPADVVPRDENYYRYPKPVDAAYMEKWHWLETKRTHPYKGENYDKRIRD